MGGGDFKRGALGQRLPQRGGEVRILHVLMDEVLLESERRVHTDAGTDVAACVCAAL